MSALLVAWVATAALAGPVRGAVHDGAWTGTRVTWTTRAEVQLSGHVQRAELVAPLDDVVWVAAEPAGVVPVLQDGALVAVDLPAQVSHVRFVVEEPAGEGQVTLDPPLFAGTTQRVWLGDARFSPDASTGVEHRLTTWAHTEIAHKDRVFLERVVAGRVPWQPRAGSVYLFGDQRVAGGLTGELRPAGYQPWFLVVIVGSLFVLFVVALLAVRRWLAWRARVEDAEAYLRDELGLGSDVSAGPEL